MKTSLIQLLIIIQSTCALYAQNARFLPLNATETLAVKQELSSFEDDKATLNGLTDSQAKCKKVIEYYLSHTNEVTAKMKLPISKSYAGLGEFSEAARLSQEYVNVFSNDWRGWSILGGCKLTMKSYDEALCALTNAARLGDDKNYAAMAMAATEANRPDVLRDIAVPRMLKLKDVKQTPKKYRLDMVVALVVYALKEEKKDVFVEALNNVQTQDILSRNDLKFYVEKGCDEFEGKDIDKIRKELEVGVTKSSNSSSTNVIQ